MEHLEILAPAGGEPQLLAAVRAGADAVYLGAGGFNARAGADNFAGDNLHRAVAYCHSRGVRVYVTLNTLVTQRELPQLLEELRHIAASGCDAVIVQDLGVARLVRDCCPSLPLHASTQTSVHNVQGVLALEELGFSRVVLARELSAQEIHTIGASTSIELEAFVHGALCMSVSGQCYLSSMLGGRSGNRGLCAQPCRLDFSAGGRSHVLSLKDLSLVQQLPQLAASGVCCLKIEGRLKRPEYVAAAVDACRRARAGETPDLDTLRAVFSRGGFTDGYFTGQRDLSMFGIRTREDVGAAAGVLGGLEALTRRERPSIPVSMTLTLAPGHPATLEVRDGCHQVTVTGPEPQEARTRPTDEELARRGLEKTGGTPFRLEELTCRLAPGLMVPVSVLNTLRSQALEQLLLLRETATRPHPFALRGAALWQPRPASPKAPRLRLRLEHPGQLTPSMVEAAQSVSLPLEAFTADPTLLDRLGDKAAAELPLLTFPGREDRQAQELAALRDRGLTAVVAGGLGAIRLGRDLGLRVQGDYSLNILNAQALAAYGDLGVADTLLSFEGSLRQAPQLGETIPCGVIGYGHLPLMTVRNCPARGPSGGCGDCRGRNQIVDRRGNPFPVLCRERQYAQLLNPVPLWLGDRQQALSGLSFVTLRFTLEDAATCNQVLARFLAQEPFFADSPRTGGLYFRELL